MKKPSFRIGVVAPGGALDPAVPARVMALAQNMFGAAAPDIHYHPQCSLSAGHFAGTDEERARAFVEIANDDSFDALWWARGGYGACRIAALALSKLSGAARRKIYLGYSDAGFLLAGLYRAGFERLAHGPVATDIKRANGEAAVARALKFFMGQGADTIEAAVASAGATAAFNITVLSHLLGTQLEPDLADHVLMLEDVSEHLYRIDRALFHIASQPSMKRVAGIRLGRVSDILPNEPEFGMGAEEIVRHWCEVSGITYLGGADIGHDADNKIVPFGRWRGS
jgi:muramoyltetrapeptide carboxypeptidase